MVTPTTGTVTFLYTDIEGSTRLWEERPAATRAAVDRHFALLRDAIGVHGGHVFRTQGDGLCAAFATAPPALAAALAAQLALHREPWPSADAIRVRMALHTGAAEAQDGDYVGACLNRVGRLLRIGHGGQTLVSRTTYDLVREALPGGGGLRDLGAHRLRDLTAPEQLFQLLHPELPEVFPPLKSLDALPNNLPLQTTSFVGRERQLAEVRELLARSRLLTLTGTGGGGKTRLALQLAADLIDAYPDGVWFVDLAPITDAALVPAAALATLGARETPGQETSAALVEHLRARRLLLLLDNCEHVIDAAARLCDALLQRCPAVRLLTTSREVLGVSGETAWRVPSLALPDPAAERTAAELGRCESAQLFVDRALAVQPAFRVTDQNAAAVARICERLDGIPLALELAAARVRVLTVEQIDQRLGDRFRLLTGGGRTALRRQQTLRALVDWSHDLLAEGERALLRRLAVFAGGWALEAAEAVCGFAPLAPEDVLDLLTALVDKSLVVAEPSGTEERYRLLETLRQYAQEKLVAADEEDETRGRHRDWCLALAERAEPELTGPRQGAWLDRLEAEHDNLRAALAWCRAGAPGRDVGLRLASPLMIFWYQRGYAREGQAWLEDALARGGAAPPTVRAHALNAAGFLAMRQGDFDRARVLVEEAMRLDAGEPPDRPRVASPRNTLAHLLMGQQQWERARELMLEELAETRRRGDRHAEALACAQLGRVGTYAGAYADAQSWFEQSIAVARARGDPFLVQSALIHLAVAKMAQGDYVGARAAQRESAAIRRELGNREGGPLSLTILGQIARLEGEASEARACFSEAARLFRDLGGERRYLSWTLDGVAGTAAEEGHWARAARLFGAATAARAAVGDAAVPVLADRNEHDLARARAALGESFAAAWSEGHAMTLEQAITHALEEAPEERAAARAGSATITDRQPE